MKTIRAYAKQLISVVLSFSLLFSVYDFKVDNSALCAHGICTTYMIQPSESIWNSIRAGLTLDHQVNSPRVQAEIKILLANKAKLYAILKSSAPYIYFIHQETKARKLPAEIALIPVIESEFNPNDHSRMGATGLWQLMRPTAKFLGVTIKANYDGRRSVIYSTKAALIYFTDLQKNFKGNWYLTIGAYNSGQGRIQSAVRRTGTSNFWSLKLPKETKIYVPKLLAVAEIIKNPQKYGVVLPAIPNRPYFAELKLKKSLTLTSLSKLTGTDLVTLKALNPDYRPTSALPDKKGIYTLLVPVQNLALIKNKLSGSIILA
jgi:membrane-bound lytic murein transglycosylase D